MNHPLFRKIALWLISLSTLGFLGYKLITFTQWYSLGAILQSLLFNKYFFLTLFLPFINIAGEAFKWQTLLSPTVKFSFSDSLKSVLSGISTGILTPGRIGEIGGRILPHRTSNLAFSSTMFVVGSLFQTIITLALGLLAFSILDFPLITSKFTSIGIIIPTLFALLLLIIYILLKRRVKHSVTTQLLRYKNFISQCSTTKLLCVATISISRYFIYTIQLFIALQLFNPNIHLISTLPLIFVFYFGITFLPGFLVADLGIRGSLAIFLFGPICSSTATILMPIYLIWLLNSCIPALLGLWFLTRQK